ncbi:MAG: GNAT family N-acetyltransferase [Planctomycetaceae bacterium]|jgi:CRISPR/Cas system-associated protein endoribonuclease Cas2|nr:GNAT family N-acetyltransferase [Planctomycetaceae bacterium]
MITWLNQWADQSRFRKFWGIVKEIFWIDQLWIFEFHLKNNDSDNYSDDNLNNNSDAPAGNDSGIIWKIATEEDIDRMKCLGCYDIDSKRDAFMKSFVQSHHEYLLLGIKNETIHTYAVCAVQAKRMYGLLFRLEEEEAFISVCFTKPESRGQGWGPKCIREICRRCTVIGKKRVFIDISTANHASIRSAEKSGAAKTDSGYYCIRIWKKDHLLPFGSYKNRFLSLKKIN